MWCKLQRRNTKTASMHRYENINLSISTTIKKVNQQKFYFGRMLLTHLYYKSNGKDVKHISVSMKLFFQGPIH